jgi:hypothetical protein
MEYDGQYTSSGSNIATRNDGPIACTTDELHMLRKAVLEMTDKLASKHTYLGTSHMPVESKSMSGSLVGTEMPPEEGAMHKLTSACFALKSNLDDLKYQVNRFDLVS